MPEWHAFLRDAIGLDPGQAAAGLQVLDLACGTGEISRMLCGLGADVTGLDFSEDMLARAKTKLAGQSWTPVLGDAEHLIALDNDSFDFVVTRHLAWTLTAPDAAFAEWFRVLRPGGRLLVNDGNWAKSWSLAYRAKRMFAQFLDPEPPVPRTTIAAHDAIFDRLPYRDGLTERQLSQALVAAGFVPVARLDPKRLYSHGMRGHSLAERLRQTHEKRFALVMEKPA